MVDQAHNQEAARRAAEDARKADHARRQAAAETARKTSEAARQSSAETLREQENMRPVPSQEDADNIRAGASDPLDRDDDEQPEGPALRASQGRPDSVFRTMRPGGEMDATYETRSQTRAAGTRKARGSAKAAAASDAGDAGSGEGSGE